MNVNATINSEDYSLFLDYDYSKLQSADDETKIEWVKKRIDFIFINPLEPIFDTKSPEHSGLNAFGTTVPKVKTPFIFVTSVLVNGVEALGSFLLNSGSSKRSNFMAFMSRYMPDWKDVVDILWKKYRNGITHGFAISGAGLDDIGGMKFEFRNDALVIDIFIFWEDLKMAIQSMFKEIQESETCKQIFITRLNNEYNLN